MSYVNFPRYQIYSNTFHIDIKTELVIITLFSSLCTYSMRFFSFLREAFNKKKHSFYGIFHNRQTPPTPVMEKKHLDAGFLTFDFRHVISETLRNV